MMENSILESTKKILGVSPDYTAFDLDIITHINSVFSILYQMGIGPVGGYFIEDAEDLWKDYIGFTVDVDGVIDWTDAVIPRDQFNMIRTYLYLKVRMLFDPPTTGFLIDAMNNQIAEHEWRLSTFREMVQSDELAARAALVTQEEVVW